MTLPALGRPAAPAMLLLGSLLLGGVPAPAAGMPEAGESFEVVFLADFLYANDVRWLTAIKQWGATGINLRVFRSEVESSYGTYDFRFMRSCLETIASQDLDVYVRVSTGLLRPAWQDEYGRDDFHQTRGGRLIDNYHVERPGVPLLNLTSRRARGDLLRFFTQVVAELDRLPPAVRRRVRAIIPTLSPDDETELPAAVHRDASWHGGDWWGWLSGYSRPEKVAFMRFLRRKYNGADADTNADRLNQAWGSSFRSIDTLTIKIDDYDWERIRDVYAWFPAGREDFLEFREGELARFVDSCSTIARKVGFWVGAQFGALYDPGIEFRAVRDITPLCRGVSVVVSDDVPEYAPNFSYAADLMRTVSRFWTSEADAGDGRIRFGTETNWPGYGSIVPDDLIAGWTRQLETWYGRGGSLLFVSHWGTVDGAIPATVPLDASVTTRNVGDIVRRDELLAAFPGEGGEAYERWRLTLRDFGGKAVSAAAASAALRIDIPATMAGGRGASAKRPEPSVVGTLRAFNGRDSLQVAIVRFPIPAAYDREVEDSRQGPAAEAVDVVTDHMVKRKPRFLDRYSRVFSPE